MVDHPIGAPVDLPQYITNNKAVIALQKDEHNNFAYQDNLCFFRCLAVHMQKDPHAIQEATETLFYECYGHRDTAGFPGVKENELDELETKFELNINVYRLLEYGEEATCEVVRRSHVDYPDTMSLNLYEAENDVFHFSYISDFDKYAKSFSCYSCRRLFDHAGHCNKHQANCHDGTTYQYTGGVYLEKNDIFEQLEQEGVHIEEELRYHKQFAVFDYEVLQVKENLPANTARCTWERNHVPLSYSVCSNIPGHEEPYFVESDDPTYLVETMVVRLLEIQATQREMMVEKYSEILDYIEVRIEEQRQVEPEPMQEEDDSKDHRLPLEKLKQKFLDWLNELVVVGFNSGKYDINVIKPHLLKTLRQYDPISFAVKRSNDYMCLKGKKLKFVDLKNFLAPGYNYDAFVTAHQCKMTKGHFPYEWLDSYEKLFHTSLPEQADFFSVLKNRHISDADYAQCQAVWKEEGMSTMFDFLEWYNNRDVVPFVEALEKQQTIYREKMKIDMLRHGISVPGLCMRFLFKALPRETYFTLFGEKDKDLYHTVKANIVGGPAIIFHRYHEAEKTLLRTNKPDMEHKMCKGIVGYDANSLYLWAMQQPMPTGWFWRWQRDEPEGKLLYSRCQKFTKNSNEAYLWLQYLQHRDKTPLRTSFNEGEKKLGRRQIPVDGFDASTETVYQFHGCYWHGHQCELTTAAELQDPELQAQRREQTADVAEYLENQLSYTVVTKRECEWYADKKTDPEVKAYLKEHHPIPNIWKPLDDVTIKKRILNKSGKETPLFGMIECSLAVPKDKREHFSEMTPIFKNADISLNDIGDTMKTYAEKYDYLTKPRRSLIGSYSGEKILLTTPLLKWYLEHGLEVSEIFQVVEYTAHPCFKDFGETVAEARRQGVGLLAILADTFKLLGNSAYGKTITDKERHVDVKFPEEREVPKLVREPRFKQINEVCDDVYEVTMAKKILTLDLPSQIGFFVYQYAKLRMLEFYYDFLDKYVDRSDFEYVEMDTDSAYIALSGPTLESVLKPDKVDEFYEEREKWLPSDYCAAHKAEFKTTEQAGLAWTRADDEAENYCAECRKSHLFTKRTPGLFKMEWQGKGMIAPCSKTYYGFGDDGDDKVSAKGIVKHQNDLNPQKFLDVIVNRMAARADNYGFRVQGNQMYSYSQRRDALTYFYIKRKVGADNMSTLPLDI